MTTKQTYTDQDYVAAQAQLASVILGLALRKIDETKIFPDFREDAPNNHADLVLAGEAMALTGLLPIWNGASDTAIYSAYVNRMFRYWHDMGHLEHGKSFSDEDETALQFDHHLGEIERQGIIPGSLAWKLYHADTIGQIQYNRANGRFPDNQLAFDRAYVEDWQAALKEYF